MNRAVKITLIIGCVAAGAGIGYFIYEKLRVDALNKKVSTLQQTFDVIDQVQAETGIPEVGSEGGGGDVNYDSVYQDDSYYYEGDDNVDGYI